MFHIRWCVMKRQIQWHLAHGFNSLLCGVIDPNVFVTCDEVIYILLHHIACTGSLASSCAWFIVKLHLNPHWQLDLSWMLKNKWKDPQQGTLALYGSWNDLEYKVITQQPKVIETFHWQTLCTKEKKVRCARKSDLYRKNCSMQPRKPVWGGVPRCGRGLRPADRACRWQCTCPREGPRNSCWFG